ncbi:MAG: polysaccharide deacetylase family protein [Bacilli bacterium]|nr:polysaccharide deacetylase family protein [Bacilli bacterium]
MKKKTKVLIIFIIIIGILVSFFVIKKIQNNKILLSNKNRLKEIKSHYNNYVKVIKETNLYNNKYKKIGTISKNKKLILKKQKITKDTKYFNIDNTNYYVSYKDVKKTKKFNIDNRYKSYIPFNENVITHKNFKLYQDDKEVYKMNISIDTPILVKEDNRYYIEFNNELYYIFKEDTTKTYNKNNTNLKETNEIPVTTYHFIYLEGEVCGEVICHHENQIKEEFNYLKENKYFTINTKEMEWFIDKKIKLPEKTILVTIDDGARAEKFIPFLEKYKINATLFLVTSWYSKDKFKSPYLEIASHSDNLHEGGKCPGDQGSPLKCVDKNILLKDLKTSREKLDNTEAFCYPFFEFNDYSESVLKEAGFKSAYIGTMKKAKQGINKYRIPRITIFNDTSLDDYIKHIK